jgi:hypothetical protein
MSTATYHVKKRAIGGYSVSYECPHCNAALTSNLTEAGTSQPCPTSAQPFLVPGKKELDQLRREKEQRLLQQQKEKQEQETARAEQRQQLEAEQAELEARQKAEEQVRKDYWETHCPLCYEEIKPKAKKCRHCGEYLDTKLRAEAAKVEVVSVKASLDDVFWLLVKVWVAALLFGFLTWLLVMLVIAVFSAARAA